MDKKEWHVNNVEDLTHMVAIRGEIENMTKAGEISNEYASLIFEEMYMNVANYAYPKELGYSEKPCDVVLERIDDESMVISDGGIPFDPTKKALKGDLDPLQVGGHGIRIARMLSKDMVYRRIDNRNVLKIIF